MQWIDREGYIPKVSTQIEQLSQGKGQGEIPLRTGYRMTWEKTNSE